MANGALSVDTEHLFPIIKKWLYSEKDIYLREVLSNSCDAVTKHKRLVSLGEAQESAAPYRIDISVDKEARTITVTDNGIGMSGDEVERYINNIALSGAVDFISKYEGRSANGQILYLIRKCIRDFEQEQGTIEIPDNNSNTKNKPQV